MTPSRLMQPVLLLLALIVLAGCVGGGTRSLQLLSGKGAVYPPDARADGVEGYVDVRYDVDADGRVVNASVVSAAPEGVFEEAALEAVSSWRFKVPPARQGAPEPVTGLESRLTFALGGGAAYDTY